MCPLRALRAADRIAGLSWLPHASVASDLLLRLDTVQVGLDEHRGDRKVFVGHDGLAEITADILRMIGWNGRIRTYIVGINSASTYQLADIPMW